MSIEGLLVSLVIILVSLGVVALPFVRSRPHGHRSQDDVLIQKQHERLMVYYERVLTNLRDLDEDYSTGKMQPADYETEREEWMQRGIEVLKALDQLDQHHVIVDVADDEAFDRAIDRQIEKAVSEHRKLAQH